MSNNRQLTIAHLHVADKKNKGDVAIVLAVQELLHKHFPNSHLLNISLDVLKKGTAVDLKKINSADLIIIGGGGIFYSYFLPYNLDFIKSIKKPFVLFGIGYIREIGAPKLNKKQIQSVSFFAKSAALIGVRDNNTKDFLIQQGVSSSRIKVIGDPAVLLKEVKVPKFEKCKKSKNKIKKITPIRIGLNLNYSGWLGFGRWENDILNSYKQLAEYFQKNYDAEIYYLQHHPSEKNIYGQLKIKNLQVIDLAARQQKYFYGQLDLVIGMMLHSGVLAFGAGTPEISVAYDLRNFSFAEFIGHPELVIDLNKLKKGELLKRAQMVFTDRVKYRLMFKKLKMKIAKKQNNFLEEIAKLEKM
jgi:polysaccharide pyruvyl transferase WcaK-like protein